MVLKYFKQKKKQQLCSNFFLVNKGNPQTSFLIDLTGVAVDEFS